MALNDSKTQPTEQQKYVLQMAKQNLLLVIDQVESISEDDTYADILKALDAVKDRMDKAL